LKGILGAILFLIFLSSLVFAVPGIPHQFYGTVTVNGNPAHGASIVAKVAKINSVEVASTLSSNGTYGYYPNVFFIQDPNSTNAGKKIEFFLNATKVAEAPFENGASTLLALSIGTSTAVCGDATCNASENCSTCPGDCGQCPPPVNPPTNTGGGGGGAGGGGAGGGGGGSALLTLLIDGNCISQTISVVVKSGTSPLENAEVTVMHNQKQVGKQTTGSSGKLSFTFSEAGKYTFTAKRGTVYSSNPKTIELVDCNPPTIPNQPQPIVGNEKSCTEINCGDLNPCTKDSCTSGVCVYSNASNGTKCQTGNCLDGKCVKPITPPANPPAFTGFFGMGMTGNVIAGIIVLFGVLSFGKFYKKKFGN